MKIGAYWLNVFNDGAFNFLLEFAQQFIFVDERLSKSKTLSGPELAMTIEFPIQKHYSADFRGSSTTAFFVRSGIIYTVKRATLLAGSPDLFNGQSVSFGVPLHF